MQGRDNPMKSPLRLRDPVLAAALAAVAMTGCHSTMTSAHDPSPAGSDAVPPNMVPPPGHGPFTGTVADWPLWFVRHEFGVSTYSTYGCKVIYNNFMRVNEPDDVLQRSEEHTSELQSLMRISYAVFCLKKKTTKINITR